MSLPGLLDIPDGEEKVRGYFFQNAQHHLLVRTAIQQRIGANLPIYVLDPINYGQFDKFLADHQQAHNDINGLLGTQSNDLESVNWDDPIQKRAWAEIHYTEHLAWATLLKI